MVDTKSNALSVRTPEGIEFSMQLAGPVSRFLAWFLDSFCVMAVLSLAWKILQVVSAVDKQTGVALGILAGFVVTTGYCIVMEWFCRGQTVGKRLLHLKVIDEQGMRLRFSQVAVRNLLRAVDSLPLFYLAGGIACALSRRSQRLGDIAANTVVIKIPDIRKPNLERLAADKYNSLRDWPHLAVRLRQTVSPEEAFLALRALLRRDELGDEGRLSLYRELANHFQSLVKFPREGLEGLTDERYLLDAVDVIFRARPEDR